MSDQDSQVVDQKPLEKTFEDYDRDWRKAEPGSPEEVEALAKMAELATTYDQWDSVYCYSDSGSELEARAEAEMAKFDKK